jgi:class 3 adenylate cyclase/uncharacterized protein YigA (DUF484 family)
VKPATPPRSETELLQALDELGRSLAGELDLARLARRATAVLKQRLGLTYVALALVDTARGVAEYLGHAADVEPNAKPGDTQPLGRGLVGRAACEGRAVHVEDVRRDPDYVEIIPGVVSELAVPVRSRDRVVAVLNCEALEPDTLRGRAVFLEIAADRLGAAMDNALLLREKSVALEAANHKARELELVCDIARIASRDLELRPMLQRMADALARAFDWEFVACMTVDADRGRFMCEAVASSVPTDVHVGYGRALGSGVVGEVAQTGKPILLDDVRAHANYVETLPGAKSELCVPVWSNERVIAAINLESTRPAAFHDRGELLEIVAEQVAGAIANAALFGQLKRRAQHLAMVSELSRQAMEATELQPLLDRVVDYVHRRMGLPLVAILLLDEKGEEMELVAHAGPLPISVARGARWPVGSGIVGRAIRSGEPQQVTDVRADPDYVSISPDITSELAVPIRFRDRVLGVVNVEATSPEALSPDAVLVVRTLVDQTAGAIHMAALNRRLAEANRTLAGQLERGPDVARELVVDASRIGSAGERRDASIMFVDIRAFTELSRRMEPNALLALLNDALARMAEAVFAERGRINRFLGDGFLAVFGVPERHVGHPEAAVRAALEIQKRVEALAPRWEAATGETLRVAIAIACGEVVAGSVGDPRHREYTVVGDAVNVAARLEAEAKARDARVLVSGSVVDALGGRVPARLVGTLDPRGALGAVRLYQVL